MRLVHFADCHLGFKAYDRTTRSGINLRENDVATSFTNTITKTIALAPELVLIAGDVFHFSRPSNHAITHAYEGFRRLTEALPGVPIVIAAGNHDSPRTSESGNILGLFRNLGIHVVDGAAQTIDLPELDACVLAVPDNHHERPELRPTGGRRWNVLVMHGETGGISPKGSAAAEREISDEAMHHDAWDYIAMGHYHVYREVGPRAYYSGATDYSSSDVWSEHVEERAKGLAGKGIVERDLATGAQTFHPLPRTREFIDAPPVNANGCSAAEIDLAIADTVEALGGIDGKVVRLVVQDLDRQTERALDYQPLRQFKKRALQFQLKPRRPEVVRIGATSAAMEAIHRRAPLPELIEAVLKEHTLPVGLDRNAFVALGRGYVAEAEREEAKRVTVKSNPGALAHAKAVQGMGLPDPYETGEVDEMPTLISAVA